jgi:sugar (pentulose or hexulose) kinase
VTDEERMNAEHEKTEERYVDQEFVENWQLAVDVLQQVKEAFEAV